MRFDNLECEKARILRIIGMKCWRTSLTTRTVQGFELWTHLKRTYDRDPSSLTKVICRKNVSTNMLNLNICLSSTTTMTVVWNVLWSASKHRFRRSVIYWRDRSSKSLKICWQKVSSQNGTKLIRNISINRRIIANEFVNSWFDLHADNTGIQVCMFFHIQVVPLFKMNPKASWNVLFPGKQLAMILKSFI